MKRAAAALLLLLPSVPAVAVFASAGSLRGRRLPGASVVAGSTELWDAYWEEEMEAYPEGRRSSGDAAPGHPADEVGKKDEKDESSYAPADVGAASSESSRGDDGSREEDAEEEDVDDAAGIGRGPGGDDPSEEDRPEPEGKVAWRAAAALLVGKAVPESGDPDPAI